MVWAAHSFEKHVFLVLLGLSDGFRWFLDFGRGTLELVELWQYMHRTITQIGTAFKTGTPFRNGDPRFGLGRDLLIFQIRESQNRFGVHSNLGTNISTSEVHKFFYKFIEALVDMKDEYICLPWNLTEFKLVNRGLLQCRRIARLCWFHGLGPCEVV